MLLPSARMNTKTELMSFRVTPDDLRLFGAAADADETPIPEWARTQLRLAAYNRLQGQLRVD